MIGAAATQRYTILDLDEGEAFVNVDLDDNSNYGTTFGSDRFDREFSEVLRYASSSFRAPVLCFVCVVSPVYAFAEGIIAPFSRFARYNKRDPSGRVDFRRIFGLEGIYVANRFNASDAKFAQTVITFNKGSTCFPSPSFPPIDSLTGQRVCRR
jgi:hypothetical protein